MKFRIALTLFCIIGNLLYSKASEQNVMEAQKTTEKIELDGILQEAAWSKELALPITQQTPNYQQEPTQATQIILLYDDEFLYVGGRLFDSEPDKIQQPSKKRDELSLSNDWLGIVLDTYNDNENALCFFTTPAGLRLDMTVFEDANGEMPVSTSWNTFWDVATHQDDKGWYVEMRIPFSSLRFQTDENGDAVMGVISWRWIAYRNELDIFPDIRPDWGFWSAFKPSQAQKIVFKGLANRRPVFVSPYGLTGMEQSFDLNEAETAYERSDNNILEAGLDIKYSLTSNLTLDLTINTDFAQVEADDQQVNLTRFSLFFPEKRLFFQERSSVFDVRLGGPNRVFYSRKIGLTEDGEPLRILGGARLVGRAGPYDLGFMSMQTAAEKGLNSENLSVFRLRRQVFNPFSYAGTIITNRMDFDGNYNTVAGLDGIFRIWQNNNDYLKVRYIQSFENDKANRPFSLDNSRFMINWEKIKYEGFVYDISFSHMGVDYNPGLGFETREDYNNLWYVFKYGWIGGENSKLLRHQLQSFNNIYYNNFHDKRESTWNAFGWEFQTKSSMGGGIFLSHRRERVFEAFEIDDLEIPVGDYAYTELEMGVGSPSSGLFRIEGGIGLGGFYNGKRFSAVVQPLWNVSSSLELSGTYEFNRLKLPDQGAATVQIGRIKALIMLSTKFSIASFIQYNSAAEIFLGNFRLRYNPREGNDFYIVFNENINSQRNPISRFEPMLPVSNGRTLLLKYRHTFVL